MTPAAAHFILATAGHVDHGKSALVRALTGGEPDRLPEEKARGMTIELGFAHLSLERDGRTFDVGVVDVPGHEDFVRNMVAGVGAIDVALFVIAADDGWMPQTEEHAQILAYLGVSHAVVALTKVDLVDDVAAVGAVIRQRLVGLPFADAPIVSTSIPRGTGIDALKDALGKMLAIAAPKSDVGMPRLAVDRAFSIRGIGTVVTGTLVGGTIARGDAIIVCPRGTAARARLLQTHGRDVDVARPGSRVALNLPELKVGETVARGDVVTTAGVGVVTTRVDVAVTRSARDADASPIASGLRVVVHHGTASTFATVRTFDRRPIAAGDAAIARLTLERPLLLLVGDRLLLRDSAQRTTLAGAAVLDAAPPADRRRDAAQATMLAARATDPSIDVAIASQIARDGALSIEVLERSLSASRDGIAATVVLGVARLAWRRAGSWLVDPTAWGKCAAAIVGAVEAHHSAHPEHAGVSPAIVRGTVKLAMIDAIYDAVVDELAAGPLERVGGMLRRRTHLATLPPRLRAAGDAIRRQLAAAGLEAPSRKELARDDASIQALRFLIADASLVEIGPDLVLSDEAFRAAASRVTTHLRAASGATVSELKQMLGSCRRVVVPLLERLDRDGVTRRVGDRRELGPRAP